ncbi:hypothetical protein RB213_015781 [Colletotrichum asianum]
MAVSWAAATAGPGVGAGERENGHAVLSLSFASSIMGFNGGERV